MTVPLPSRSTGRRAPELGRLGAELDRLAGMQGEWPARRPARVQVVELPTDLQPPDAATGDATAGDATARGAAIGAATARGAADADGYADSAVDLLVLGCPGPAAPALTAIAALLEVDPVTVVGITRIPGWADLVTAVRDGYPAARQSFGDGTAMLDAAGDPALAYLAGLLAQGALRRTPMLIDGTPTVIAAALVADRLSPGARDWLLPGCSGSLPASRLGLTELGLTPLLDLQLGVPGGARIALEVLCAGVELLGA